MNLLAFFILSSSTWRIASLIANEHGPFMFLERFRFRCGVHYHSGETIDTFSKFMSYPENVRAKMYRVESNELAKLIDCVWCSSPWIGAILTIAYLRFGQPVLWFLLPLSVSAVAILLNRIMDG